MRHINRLIGTVVSVLLVGLAASGCVEEQTSLKLRGVAAPDGSVEEETVNCPPNAEDQTETPKFSYSCSDISPGSVSEFFSSLSINLSTFGSVGQLTETGGDISDEGFCAYADPPTDFTNNFSRSSSYIVTLDVINQLEDSREIGAEGEGGGSQGGFNGLKTDQNSIETRALKVRFPQVDASELERDIQFTMVVDSAEGAIAPSLSLFDQSDVGALRDLHQQVASQRADGSEEATVTITMELWLVGETFGGSDVESNRLTFPLRLCGQGCGTTPRCAFETD